MASTADGGAKQAGLDSIHRLKSTEPPFFLSPSPDLSQAARSASQYLFSSLKPFAPKSPFSQLLTEGFDAEQIWQQIDLQSQPLLVSLRRHVKKFEKNPEEIQKQFDLERYRFADNKKEETETEDGDDDDKLLSQKGGGIDGLESQSEGSDEDEEEEEEGEDDDDGEMEGKENINEVEDKFLKIKELEEYLVDDEEKEYGLKKEKKKRKRDEIRDDDEDEEGDEEDDEFGLMGLDEDEEEEEGNKMENARYEEFFGGKRTGQGKKPQVFGRSDDSDMDYGNNNQKKNTLSTHEKELEKLRSEIEMMEKSNLDPKAWMMQGEVTAARRPKNSALEVDLDFEHNVRPAPVITEEVTASLEELIHKRILEGRFDDVQKPPTLPSKSPREKIELDENKSEKGLAALYEDEYVQKTGLVSTAMSFKDEQKKEANMLFRKLCLKLDALSHFHFTPKPVIEDMSIQANVPALAMEEIAPLAVSDAAMLAPEELFAGRGDVKEETELTKAERKRRRANKKRKFKGKTLNEAIEMSLRNQHRNPKRPPPIRAGPRLQNGWQERCNKTQRRTVQLAMKNHEFIKVLVRSVSCLGRCYFYDCQRQALRRKTKEAQKMMLEHRSGRK